MEIETDRISFDLHILLVPSEVGKTDIQVSIERHLFSKLILAIPWDLR